MNPLNAEELDLLESVEMMNGNRFPISLKSCNATKAMLSLKH